MKNGYRILDSDLHIFEPPDLWPKYIDSEFKHLAPICHEDHVRDFGITRPAGAAWGKPWTPPRAFTPRPDLARAGTDGLGNGKTFNRDQLRYRHHHDQQWSPQVQLEAMDEEGIDVAMLYPSRGLLMLGEDMDPRFAAAIARAYNDWLYDFCKTDNDRLIGVAMISPFDINDAVAETRRCTSELGFRGIFLKANILNGRAWHDPYYDPLWSTLEELDVPVGFHGPGGPAGTQFEYFQLSHVFYHPVEQQMALASFCGAGIFERHPRLRAAFLEGNCSWLPWLLWRLDEHWELFGDVQYQTKLRPSEYFKRQGYVSVDCEENPVKYAIDYLGNDNIVFSTDFPHVDAQFPHSSDKFLQLPISDEDKRKILWDNCATFYGARSTVAPLAASNV